jgi:6-phosphogluconolactonase
METLVILRRPHGQIHVLKDLEAISHHACSLFIRFASDSLAGKEAFAVALSGGSTPKRFYALLGSVPYRNQIDWRRVHCFWADGGAFPSIMRTVSDGLRPVFQSPDPLAIHRIKGRDRESAKLQRTVPFGRPAPVFDLIILGMGEDGHTASLFLVQGSKRGRVCCPCFGEDPT